MTGTLMSSLLNSNMVEIDVINLYGRNRKTLYAACVRNQYFLPELGDKAVTLEFLINVATSKFFIPRLHEMSNELACIDPPTKTQLAEMLYESIEMYLKTEDALKDKEKQVAFHLTAAHFKETPPAKRYSVRFLALMDPNNAIFQKGYKRPPRPSKFKDLPKMTLPISNDFFEGLPQLELSEIKGRRGLKLSKK